MSSGKILTLLLLVLGLTSCAPFVDQGLPAGQAGVGLEAGQSVGQTCLADHDGLTGVQIFLSPRIAGTGEILLHLRANPQSQSDLAVSALAVPAVTASGFYRFSFSPQVDSRLHDYYLLLELTGEGKVRVGTVPGDAYLNGAAYRNSGPLDAQTSFRLLYAPEWLWLGVIRQTIGWIGLVIVAVLLFVLPGWALLTVMWPAAGTLSWAEKLGLAAGLSLAAYPLLMLWTDLVGLHLGPLYAWLPMLIALLVLLWRHRHWRMARLVSSCQERWRTGRSWHDLILAVLMGLILFVRFWAIRGLDVPLWGDSYHHTLIAQLMVDHGGLFTSWQPYAELQTFTYHFGFHSAAAAWHWVSGMAMPKSVLWVGQLLNVLAAVALYPLALRVTGNRWAGVGAVLVAGLLSPMPMYYTNWGRYTQLAGQVILPTAVYLVWAKLETKFSDWRLLCLGWVALSGLGLAHYRILIFAALFGVAYFLLWARPGQVRSLLTTSCLLAAGAGVLFAPWAFRILSGKLVAIYANQVSTTSAQAVAQIQQYNSIGDLSLYLPVGIWLLLPIGLAWGLWRRERGVALISLWWFLVLLAANPQWLHLPGEGILSNFAVFIAAYIPVGLVLGGAFSWFVHQSRGYAHGLQGFIVCSLCLLAGWGAVQRLGDLHPELGALVTRPDIRAATWIEKNTPQNARFMVNSFFTYGDTVIVGSDGGWWLPVLAQRQTTLPPMNYESEQGPRPDYMPWVNALWTLVRTRGIDSDEVAQMLAERGVTYVYIGQRQGRVNYDGPEVLKPEQLLADAHFQPVYHQDRVWVFEFQK